MLDSAVATTRASIKEQRRELVREEILDAAGRVVLERGVSGLTLTAVARELGLTKAALYYYFDSREALVFELVYRAHATHARAVAPAVEGAASGAEALEALIRAASEHYGANLDALRLAYLVPQVGTDVGFGNDELARMRPFNEMLFGTVGRKIASDQQAGIVSEGIDGRRLAFVAYMSLLGVLTMEALVERADDPLLYSHDDMVDEVVVSFVGRLA